MAYIIELAFVVTNNTKLQWLQYRSDQRILATSNFFDKEIKMLFGNITKSSKENADDIFLLSIKQYIYNT